MWGGVIAGAVGGAAKAAYDVADDQIKQKNKLDLMNAQAEIEKEKLRLAEEIRREGKLFDTTGEGGAAQLTFEGNKIDTTARATAAAAPILAQGEVAGKVAGLKAASESDLPQKQANYERATFDASKGLNTDKAVQAARDAAAGQVAKTGTQGYLKSVADEDLAKGATQIKVAGMNLSQAITMAQKPTMQSDAEGNINLVSWDPKTQKTTVAPLIGADGKPVKGPKDLDQRTQLMVKAILEGAHNELDETRKAAAINQALDLLKGGSGGAAGQYKEGDIVTLKSGKPGRVVNVDGKLVAQEIDPKEVAAGPVNTDVKDPRDARANPPAPPPPAAPLPPGLPADVENRVAAKKAADDAAAAKKREQDAKQQAWNEELKGRAAGLTVERIQALTPVEAQKMLSQYGGVLTSEQRRALNKQL